MASFNGGGDRKRCLQVLGLSPSASEDDIQQAYRRLALEHHPDKNNNNPEATRKFQEISQAYRLLTKDDSSDDDDYFPFRRHNFYDDDDDDDDDMFCGHSFFSMFAQELLFREMLRQMYAHHHHRFRSSNRYQGNQRNGERSQQRQGNRPNTRNDTRTPSWGRWHEQGQQQHNTSRINHFRSTQSDTSRHSFSSQSRGHEREETARSRQTYNRDKNGQQSGNHGQHTNGWQRDREGSERQSDKVKEDSSPCHTTESQPRSKRRNRRCRKGREPQKIVLTQPKKLSKKELLAQEKRRQREMEKIGRELSGMQINGDEECQESDDTKNA